MIAKTVMVEGKKAQVYFLGDVHTGAANHQKDAFARAVKMIAESGGYWIGMGDYLDCINHKDQKRFNPKEVDPELSISDLDNLPIIQAESFVKSVMPIAKQCLGLVAGNHETAFRKHHTLDIMGYLCEKLGVDNLSGKAFVNIIVNEIPISLHVCHGVGGGGMREGYPINKVHDIARWDIANVHVIGHVHQLACDRAVFNRYHHNKIQYIKTWYGVSGGFLSKSELNTESYFEQSPGKCSGIGMLELTIDSKHNSLSQTITELRKVYLD